MYSTHKLEITKFTSRGGGEEGPSGRLAVAVGQLGPILQLHDPGGNGAAFALRGRHS